MFNQILQCLHLIASLPIHTALPHYIASPADHLAPENPKPEAFSGLEVRQQ